MDISKTSWQRYIKALRKVSDEGTKRMGYYLQEFGLPRTAEALEDFIYTAFVFSDTYGIAAAELAAEMYEATALASGVIARAAELAPTPTIDEVAKAVRGTMKTNNPEIVVDSMGRLIKLSGVDTTLKNAIRDGAECAWIPVGETCAYCISLAASGWLPSSDVAVKNGHARHIHANCDCTYGVRFGRSGGVSGYDPSKYRLMLERAPLDEWNTLDGKPPAGHEDAEKKTPENQINALRRQFYAENSEEINEQKRSAYEKRQELDSSAAEEIDAG